ncbi:unnamed protein product [Closterium sp. NIES-64]|nr:unnamed protein product [Closterium sp. NIES-64]CAI5973143.1 unnamed protein product [Closterium sp. NIES-64]
METTFETSQKPYGAEGPALLDIVIDESSLPYGAEGPAEDGHLKHHLLDIMTDESSLPYGAEGPAVDGHLKQHVLAALQQVVGADGGSWVGRSAGDYRRQLADAWGM